MKKLLSLVLVLSLCMLLSGVAFAADKPVVVSSSQALKVDGKDIACEKYNIDGSNYFKLRDMAMLMNGTVSQFSVGYNEEKKAVEIATGEAYVSNGSELVLTGEDKSATAVVSNQTIWINGVKRSDLSVYNIGGNNYFKLRDLGGALGFDVDYDAGTRTMLVASGNQGAWAQVKSLITDSCEGVTYTESLEYILADNGAIRKSVSTASDGHGYTRELTYDEKGNLASYTHLEDDQWTKQEYTYDESGRVITDRTTAIGDVESELTYTYNANGDVVKKVETGNFGVQVYDYRYDEKGNILSCISTGDKPGSRETYTYNADGQLVKEVSEWEWDDGNYMAFTDTFTYDKYGNVATELYESNDGISWYYEWKYDADGNQTSSYSKYGDDWAKTVYTYNKRGDMIKEVTLYADGATDTSEYTVDENGVILKIVLRHADGGGAELEFKYNEDGKILEQKLYNDGRLSFLDEYTYDSNGNEIKLTETYYNDDGSVYGTYIAEYIYQYLGSQEKFDNYEMSLPYADGEFYV